MPPKNQTKKLNGAHLTQKVCTTVIWQMAKLWEIINNIHRMTQFTCCLPTPWAWLGFLLLGKFPCTISEWRTLRFGPEPFKLWTWPILFFAFCLLRVWGILSAASGSWFSGWSDVLFISCPLATTGSLSLTLVRLWLSMSEYTEPRPSLWCLEVEGLSASRSWTVLGI